MLFNRKRIYSFILILFNYQLLFVFFLNWFWNFLFFDYNRTIVPVSLCLFLFLLLKLNRRGLLRSRIYYRSSSSFFLILFLLFLFNCFLRTRLLTLSCRLLNNFWYFFFENFLFFMTVAVTFIRILYNLHFWIGGFRGFRL